ncbi:ABC transporter ATP-binding protein [Thermoflexus sp.]|uniref:ABC transporter ATP-binding protein n=1 Tax=Thermoflexus sp. TaxID=1969742 RepID=UPI0025EFAEB0|nr:ABC transporter ATP-binding protein [Thermoflexus sp.]MDW8180111.1 ABC transporter ATP-binding protein [Anaerolineae bacterium]MCS6964714.1 ABC transporter ATP-binding protein [Thermoflexus sp.]MCS7350660.1 ABC transporter ATP-binding protein [Thermoflexus sp.]MCX7690662.1 ABC transporter ATP-binding protein [Thermoflexus sp.]MDW8185799.1 ABC transporter ATP-binding protein [Anaerolineae bacterium]
MSGVWVIETEGLRKVFGDRVAVVDLTLRVAEGETFGFLGPNGAGKTTALKMLLGLILPTAGSGRVLGRPLGDRRARRAIGFLPEGFAFPDWLTAEEILWFHGRLAGVEPQRLRRRIPELLERVGLAADARRPFRALSKGMRQRLGLAQAFIHEPRLVFLDEPTSGLDPAGRILVRDFLREQKSHGVTIFLNSHLLSEVERICDRVAFIKGGVVVETMDLRAGDTTTLILHLRWIPPGLEAQLRAWGEVLAAPDNRLTLRLAPGRRPADLARWIVSQGLDLEAMIPQRLSLEEVFLQVVGMEMG